MQYFTKTQACRLLGTTMPTLNKCIKKLCEQGHDITPMRDAYNPHLALLSEDQMTAIRAFMLGYRERVSRPLSPAPSLPALPPAESKHRASQGHPGASSIPEGWISYKQMCLRHGISEREADRAIVKGIISITRGEYRVNGIPTNKVLTPEQQEIFVAWLGIRG